jgi:hypothetical protein
MKNRIEFAIKFLFLIFISFIWMKSFVLDTKVKNILNSNEVTQETILNTINYWPNAKTTELIAVRISSADTNCSVLETLGERIIEIDSRYAQGWHIEAICRNVKGNFEGAVNAIEKAVALDPLNPTYLIVKSKLGIASGNKVAASEALDVIKSNYPDNPEIAPLESSIALMP